MINNIVELITEQFADRLSATAGEATGLDAAQTGKTVRAAIPAMLAGILGAASSQSGKDALAAELAAHDDVPFNSPSGLTTANDRESLIATGMRSLKSLFGENRLGKLTSAIDSYAGIGSGNARSILGLVAPTVLGFLGRQQRAGNMDVGGMVDMLRRQWPAISGAIPKGLEEPLRSSGLLDAAGMGKETPRVQPRAEASAARAETTRSRVPPPPARKTGTRSAVPWMLAIAAVAIAAGWLLTRDRDPVVPQTDRTETVGTVDTAPGFRIGDVDVGAEVRAVTDGAARTLRDVTDATTAQNAVPQMEQLAAQFDRVTALANQLPAQTKPALAAAIREPVASIRSELERVGGLGGVSGDAQTAVQELDEKVDTLVDALRA